MSQCRQESANAVRQGEAMKQHEGQVTNGLTAKDIMHKRVITLKPDMMVQEAAQVLLDHHITGAPVVDDREKLVGVLSQTDLVRHVRENTPRREGGGEVPEYYRESWHVTLPRGFHLEVPDDTRVADVMTPAVFMTEEHSLIEKVGRLMLRKHIHRVIVVRNGTLSGIVTSMDVMRVLLRRLYPLSGTR